MNKKTIKILLIVVAALVLGSCIFMFTISPINLKKGNREMPEATAMTNEITSGVVVEQKFKNITDNINEIAIVFTRLYEQEDCSLVIELLDGNDVLAMNVVYGPDVKGDHRTYAYPNAPITGYVGKELTLRIHSDTTAGTGLAVMVNEKENTTYNFGENIKKGTICFSITGE